MKHRTPKEMLEAAKKVGQGLRFRAELARKRKPGEAGMPPLRKKAGIDTHARAPPAPEDQ